MYNLAVFKYIFQGCKEHITNFRCQSLKRHTRQYHAVLKYKNNRAETMTATIIELYLKFSKIMHSDFVFRRVGNENACGCRFRNNKKQKFTFS